MIDGRSLRVVSALVLAAASLSITGCGFSGGGERAPDIPPASTLVMDFSAFGQEIGPGKATLGADPTAMQTVPGQNFFWAAGNALVWQAVVTTTLAVPVAAFLEAFNHEPALIDGVWVWAYEFEVVEEQYSAELHADVGLREIEWNMYISKEGEFTDVNWFTGVSSVPATEGTWTLNRDPETVTPFLFIEWTRDPDVEGSGDIKYTGIEEGSLVDGSYIFYGSSPGETFDLFYDVFYADTGNMVEIDMKSEDLTGRVKDPLFYGDENWHCWDADFQDVDCPEND